MADYKGTIVVTGRGGTGKSTFTTLLARHLGESGVDPVLMVDTDPDESLAEMMGIDLEAEGKKTIADVLSEILEERKMTRMMGMTPTEKIEPYLFSECLYEGRGFFDFIGIGTKWIEGCYCLPDRSMGQIMDKWATNYEYVVVDSPAGVEHLNRRITKKVKDVFNILDPSKKSFDNAVRSYKIMMEVGIEFDNYYIVGGYRFTEALEKEAEKQKFRFLGRVSSDEMITEYNIEGKSLLELPEDSPTYQSVKTILKKVGY
ncbi:MAG: AAA family ATPase [Candidatus Bathyarchaeota archaeon]|nr:AAA family ATPase [Candidatus Bathyarchaeota archaeon]